MENALPGAIDIDPVLMSRAIRSADSVLLPVAQWQHWWDERHRELGELAPAGEYGFVLTAAQQRACGVTRAVARHAVRTERWVGAGRGVVGVVDVRDDSDPQLEARRRHAIVSAAACARRPKDVVSGCSAAIMHGLPTLNVPPTADLTERTPVRPGHGASAHLYRAAISDASITSWFGVPVTTVARTIVDLARHDPFDGIMAVDAALRERMVTTAEIERELDGARGWPFVRRARETVRFASPLAESPLESVTRLRLQRENFPDLRPQHWIGAHRVDLAAPEYRLVVECDGRGKYSDEALWNEKKREQYVRRRDWRVERVIWEDVLRYWPATSRRLWSALGLLHLPA